MFKHGYGQKKSVFLRVFGVWLIFEVWLVFGRLFCSLDAADETAHDVFQHLLGKVCMVGIGLFGLADADHVDGDQAVQHRPERLVFQPGVEGRFLAGGYYGDDTTYDGFGKAGQGGDALGVFAGRDTEAEHQLVIFLVLEGEFPVGAAHGADLAGGVGLGGLGLFEPRAQELKAFPIEFQKNSVFIFKMAIDHGYAIFDGIGDLADRKGLPSFGDDHFPGGVQDAGPHFFLLPLFSIEDAHVFGLCLRFFGWWICFFG